MVSLSTLGICRTEVENKNRSSHNIIQIQRNAKTILFFDLQLHFSLADCDSANSLIYIIITGAESRFTLDV